MNIRYTDCQHNHPPNRRHVFGYRLLVDVLPTLILLLVMACGMLLVARYTESSHLRPLAVNGQQLEQFTR